MKIAAIVLVLLLAGFALWVRLAASDPARWHVAPPEAPGRFAGGVVERVPGDAVDFARLAEIISQTPRTRLLAGALAEGRMTFITRSALWGFPDYTTISLEDGTLTIHARLRFGRSDLGVNAARVGRWLDRMQAVEK